MSLGLAYVTKRSFSGSLWAAVGTPPLMHECPGDLYIYRPFLTLQVWSSKSPGWDGRSQGPF